MNLAGPAHFVIHYAQDQRFSVKWLRSSNKSFETMRSATIPKLYIFSRDGLPIYVGATIRPLLDRLRYGFNPHAGYYHGYAFRHQGNQIDLNVWYDQDEIQPRAEGTRSGSDIETVEAEIVYLLRHRTGDWPASQTEIHFYKSETKHRHEAEKVVAFYGIG